MQNSSLFSIGWKTALGAAAVALLASACGDDGTVDDMGSGGTTATGGSESGGTSSGGSSAGGSESGGSTSGGTTSGGTSSGGTASGGAGTSGGTTGDGGMAMGGMGGEPNCSSIVDLAVASEDLSVLVAAVIKAELADALSGQDLTVFAPTNDAFMGLLSAIGADSLDDLSKEQLVPILLYHVAGGIVPASAAIGIAEENGTAETLGGTISLALDGDDLVIDPADDDEDTADFPATVVEADIEACNGVIHVIDGVLLPSIADIVTTSADLEQLAGVVGMAESAADIAGALDAKGSLTLFAPSNDAISALPAVPPASALDDILTYHVYGEGAVMAETALGLSDAEIDMLNGDPLTVDGGSAVTLTDTGGSESSVTVPDILAENGVIHVIDGVLLPESITNP